MTSKLFIINPAGNGGAGLRVWEKFQRLWKEDIDKKDVIFTKRAGHAVEIAASAKGYSTIVSVGGDGTVNEVMQGVLKNKTNPSLALIPAGTGNDIGRNVGIFSLDDAIDALEDNHINKFDVLTTEYEGEVRYSFLTANFGFSANHRIKPWMKRLLGPTIAYYLATMLELILFRPWDMTIEWDDGKYSGKTTIVLVTNVEKSSGGSMIIGPGATPTDGKITVTIVPFKSKFNCIFKEFPKLPKGEVVELPDVKFLQTKKINIQSEPPTDIDIDGELLGITPATVKIKPLSVKIISPIKKSG